MLASAGSYFVKASDVYKTSSLKLSKNELKLDTSLSTNEDTNMFILFLSDFKYGRHGDMNLKVPPHT